MKVVIVEDEKAAAENLKFLLSESDTSIYVDKIIDSVSEAVKYFTEDKSIELAFFDIHLADGISFEVFDEVDVNIPIIFTTAYDEYAIKAFKVNSVDYLLKPIDEEELKEALDKYRTTRQTSSITDSFKEIVRMLKNENKTHKSAYLVQQRDTLIPLNVPDIAYFTIDMGVVKAITFENKFYNMDENLEDIEAELDPNQFFRANRQFIVQRKAIENLKLYFNGKLILSINPKPLEQIVVSKAKAPQLKKWMD